MSADPNTVEADAVPAGALEARAMGEDSTSSRRTTAATIAITAAVLTLAALALERLGVQEHLLDLVAWIRGAGWTGAVVFVLLYVLAAVLFLPGSALTLGAGFVYGVGLGTAVVWLGANLGATAAFLLGRTVARRWVAARVEGNARFAAIDRAVGREGLKIVLLTRLSPVFPFSLLNYAFGLTKVSLRDYVAGSVVGMLPGTVMYVYLGSLITNLSELAAGRSTGGAMQQAFYYAGLGATVVVAVLVTRVARRALAEETAATANRDAAPDLRGAAPLMLPDDAHNRTRLTPRVKKLFQWWLAARR